MIRFWVPVLYCAVFIFICLSMLVLHVNEGTSNLLNSLITSRKQSNISFGENESKIWIPACKKAKANLFMYDKDLQFLFLPVYKAMSSQMTALLVAEKKSRNSTAQLKLPYEVFPVPEDVKSIWQDRVDFTNFTKWIIVRDPIERLLSAFIQVCITSPEQEHKAGFPVTDRCFGCSHDIICFLEDLQRNDDDAIYILGLISPIHCFPYVDEFAVNMTLAPDIKVFVFKKSKQFQKQIRAELKTVGFKPSVLYIGWGHGNSPFLGLFSEHASKKSDQPELLMAKILKNPPATAAIISHFALDYWMFQNHIPVPRFIKSFCQKYSYPEECIWLSQLS